MDGVGVNLFTIAADTPFLDDLAAGVTERYGGNALGLAAVTVILPTRRACRSLHEAFLRGCAGQPMLLPRLTALGDLDADELALTMAENGAASLDLPPVLPESRRRLLLTRLILQWGTRTGQGPILPAQAAALARDLARLLDQVQTERLGFEALAQIVPEELAEHWQITRDFLEIVTEHWPALLVAHDALDPAERRNRLIAAQLAAWRKQPPTNPVVAAGFSSASPAAADLLTFLAHEPMGSVILPGVDTDADETLWDAIGADPTHPQYGFHHLLAAIGATPDSLKPWRHPEKRPETAARARFLTEVMRPAGVTDVWSRLKSLPADSLSGVQRYDCQSAQEEAGVIALLLRAQLEEPGATAMLVTPDRDLARRVSSELSRWDITIDDSAGIALNRTPPGVFLRLLAQAAVEQLAPVALLALLKHPLAGLGYQTAALRDLVRTLERHCLRGPRPAPGLAGLSDAVASYRGETAEVVDMLDRLRAALAPFLDQLAQPEIRLAETLAAHLRAAEALAATVDQTGADRLWDAEAGAALADFMTELLESSADFIPIAGADYPVLLETLMADGTVRPRFGNHPRLQILGTLEARLQSADLIILGSLNEGVWPADPGLDPWMSRPMRGRFGLAPSDAQIGLAAHDFVSCLMAPRVAVTRALRAEGAPTVPSRWLLRMDTVLKSAGLALDITGPAASWQAALDRPERIAPHGPPEPRPPVRARPTMLSVTEIETWRRDPYAIYAKHILKLHALEPLDQEPGAADRGSFIHTALDQYLRLTPRPSQEDALIALMACGRTAFGSAMAQPGVWAFWWPRFERIARWFLAWDAPRRDVIESLTERRGEIVLHPSEPPFTLRARVDRIDRLRDGGLVIIDYKTGGVPSGQDVFHGYAPQLPLEAAIAAQGGFPGIAPAPVNDLLYLKLSGGDPAGEEIRVGGKKADPAALAVDAIDGLESLIREFSDVRTPYLAQPRPDKAPRYGDYAHLARLDEWGGGSGE